MLTLRERNAKEIERVLTENEDVKALRSHLKAKHDIDILDKEDFKVRESSWSWKKLERKLMEADASGSFTQFLRAGIQAITNDMYSAAPTTFEDWVTVVSSNKDSELHAPNHGIAFPRQVGPQEKYPEVGAAALDIQLKNYKYGSVYALTRELLDDDQTGSFQRQAGFLGEYMKILTEVLVYGKLNSGAGQTYQQYEVPVSETKPSYEANYPWTVAAAPLRGGGVTAATPGALNQANIQSGLIALQNQRNLQGIVMNVAPNRLLISPHYQFDAAILLNSSYYPSGAAVAGDTGGAFGINPLKSIVDLTVSRYVFDNAGVIGNSKAWFLVDATKPFFILQLREAAVVEQEALNSGTSFDQDIIRFKARSRMNADFLDPRFAWRGSDGSI